MLNTDVSDPLARIAFITLPDDFEYHMTDFKVDSKVALPIELAQDKETISTDELTWDATIAAMLKILSYHPSHSDADYYREFIYAAKPTIRSELTEAGVIKAHNRDFSLAQELFQSLIGLDPDDINAILNLAFAYEQHAVLAARNEEIDKSVDLRTSAEKAYQRVLEINPSHIDAHLNIAHFYLSQRRFKEVVPHLQIYLKHGKDLEHLTETRKLLHQITADGLEKETFQTAHQLVLSGLESDGIKQIDDFLISHPDVWQAHFLRGWALRRTGCYSEAKISFEEVVKQKEKVEREGLADTYNELAICNLELEDFINAQHNLLSALALDPGNTKIISNLGILSMKQGKLDEARRYFYTIIDLDPKDPIASKYLHELGF